MSHRAVRTRRAYFDCRFGQLHVRTAFPATGGFDEQVTLICLHAAMGSSRMFARFLPEIADVRSVYAPDLPGLGESDAAPTFAASDAACAVSDLASDLRLRQVDLLGVQSGAEVALELAAARPELVRRIVIVSNGAGLQSAGEAPKKVQYLKRTYYADDLFEVEAKSLAAQIAESLGGVAAEPS